MKRWQSGVRGVRNSWRLLSEAIAEPRRVGRDGMSERWLDSTTWNAVPASYL